jgi:hypothetical protein
MRVSVNQAGQERLSGSINHLCIGGRGQLLPDLLNLAVANDDRIFRKYARAVEYPNVANDERFT